MHGNLLGPEPTLLPDRAEPQSALEGGTDPVEVATSWPDFSEAWAALAERALAAGEPIAAYAYARTGYHRGLDQLRRSGWKGFGPVPWSHRPNQGFLRALAALALAARQIGEVEEYDRCSTFLADSDPAAPAALGLV
ncbi:DUF3151 domain-containing protein [Actinokineospora globicatena]|uniref:DUF3151 domain-containing protein n=1 Tax=Actinokineospora globicatena TaxID=103729 RepID=UPI0020A29F94|nr:DUF3151 domain-containing protein [Actinokineospora globicatena]MCP2301423.1 Protein of unknown function (DUF3151) [Actinokineospora globicatena]GLW76938.1 hypothetical protein Aglo01_14200 [Actinokineospora globicatena]GLW83771.1 hypothetical protein Aglo02_14110 [Actinokineospora globicatena]